jgi:hypothetical protein
MPLIKLEVGNWIRLWGLGLGGSCGDLLGRNLEGAGYYLLLRDRKGSIKESGFGAQSFFMFNSWFSSPNQAFTFQILLRMKDRFSLFLRLLSKNPKPQTPNPKP